MWNLPYDAKIAFLHVTYASKLASTDYRTPFEVVSRAKPTHPSRADKLKHPGPTHVASSSYLLSVRHRLGDGIPDAYETAHGLNPNDAKDGATLSASGYSNLELYLNSLVK